MMQSITVSEQEQFVTINNLKVKNSDFFSVVKSESQESREQAVQDILAVGSAAMQRLRTTVDVEFVEKRFGTLATVFEKSLSDLERRSIDALTKRFSPTESGSYTKQITDLVADAKREVQVWGRDFEAKSQALLDPDKKSSAVGKLEELIQNAASRFQQMFDPGVRNSYAYELNRQISQIFGSDGHSGALQSTLADALKPIVADLQDLKSKVEGKKAAEQIIESSTLKGKPFEDSVLAELSGLAQAHGDDVRYVASGSNGSRAGDFLIELSGVRKRVVVEARNRKQMSLPAIKSELDREMNERAADFAIYVSSGTEMLPQHVGDFQIYGNKLVVTDKNLHIAYRLVRVLAATETPDGVVDVGGLRTLFTKIKDAARSMRDIKTKATQIKKAAEGINVDAEATEEFILNLVADAEELLQVAAQSVTA